MLSTPPAFILSQDQTLMFKCLILAPVKTGLSGTSLWSAENEVLMCKSPICAVYFLLKVFVLWTILSFHFWNCFLNRIFRVALLFICQGSVFFCLTQLHYFIMYLVVCQELFKLFFLSQPLFSQWSFILTCLFLYVNMFFLIFLKSSIVRAKKKNLNVAKISFLHFIK